MSQLQKDLKQRIVNLSDKNIGNIMTINSIIGISKRATFPNLCMIQDVYGDIHRLDELISFYKLHYDDDVEINEIREMHTDLKENFADNIYGFYHKLAGTDKTQSKK